MVQAGWCVVSLGEVPYGQAWEYQQRWVRGKLADRRRENGLLLVEHPPVYTLGTGSTLDFLKFDPQNPPAELVRTERGGEVTYHGPGQLVAYPIVDLQELRADLHWYLRQLEEGVIQTLAQVGLRGERLPGLTGVWVEGYKVAAIAIKVTRWIAFHGLALNVCPDLAGFKPIVPCGIGDRPVGKLTQWLPDLQVKDMEPILIDALRPLLAIPADYNPAFPPWFHEMEKTPISCL